MPKITVELDDTLQDHVDSAIQDTRDALMAYFAENEPSVCPDFSDLDYNGTIHEICDSAVPVYTREIETAWYLHGSSLEQAYSDAGVGENPRENSGMTAIYFYISQEVAEWFSDNANDLFDAWEEQRQTADLESTPAV